MLITKKEFDISSLQVQESQFYIANGYLGIRACIPFSKKYDYCRGMYVNGFYEEYDIEHGEKLYGFAEKKQSVCKIMDMQSLDIFINHIRLDFDKFKLISYKHDLDLEKGQTQREFIFEDEDKNNYKIICTRFANLKNINEAYLNTYIESSKKINIGIRAYSSGNVSNFSNPNDPRTGAKEEKPLKTISLHTKEYYHTLHMQTKVSKLDIFASSDFSYTADTDDIKYSNTSVENDACFEAKFNNVSRVEFCRRIYVCDSLHFSNPEEMINARPKPNLDKAIRQHREKLENIWANAKISCSNKDMQSALEYAMYNLYCSTGIDDKYSIAAKGLSGEGYEGHIFWDAESYVCPLLTYTAPEIAKNLLRYRLNILPYAIEQARLLGHKKGALFAWRSIKGNECSAYFPAGSAQYHINADIAYACMQYYFASDDIDFLEEFFPLLYQTALLWLDLGHYNKKGFCFDMVTGPDEYTCLVNNNFYTNVSAKYNMHYCVYAYKKLLENNKNIANCSHEDIESIKKASESVYIPYSKKLKINPQDDSFLDKKPLDINSISKDKFPLLLHFHPLFLYRHQVCKQADTILAYILYPNCADEKTKKKSFKYYEKITTHDSSLSLCAFAIAAIQLKKLKKGQKMFFENLDLDLFDRHKNTKDGIHTANMGGSYLVLLKGYIGLYIDENGLCLQPTTAPFDYSHRLLIKGRQLEFKQKDGEFCVSLIRGEEMMLKMHGIEHCLKDHISLKL